jgi:ribosomal protein S5
LKGYIGLDPSKSEKAAEAAEKAAAEANNRQMIKIALDIPESDIAKAKEMISKNPQLHAHFSKITDPKKQRYFIANLVAQKKAQE